MCECMCACVYVYMYVCMNMYVCMHVCFVPCKSWELENWRRGKSRERL